MKLLLLTILLLISSLSFSNAEDYWAGVVAENRGFYAEALSLWKPLAEKGDAKAQAAIGKLYYNGQGVTQNYKTALNWYSLSAEQGLPYAQWKLGVMHLNGHGVIQDYVRSHMWFNVASSNGEERAIKYRDNVAQNMTPADISKAQQVARECVEKNYKGC